MFALYQISIYKQEPFIVDLRDIKTDILDDKTTTTEMKIFLKPVLSKEGPSGDQIEYKNLGRLVPQNILIYDKYHTFC